MNEHFYSKLYDVRRNTGKYDVCIIKEMYVGVL
jgi:hypothetical protein